MSVDQHPLDKALHKVTERRQAWLRAAHAVDTLGVEELDRLPGLKLLERGYQLLLNIAEDQYHESLARNGSRVRREALHSSPSHH